LAPGAVDSGSGINGAQEQERRATSALLAVMTSVREFGRILTQPLGAPSGNVQTYIEMPFQVTKLASRFEAATADVTDWRCAALTVWWGRR
jgi:hypothetical protein